MLAELSGTIHHLQLDTHQNENRQSGPFARLAIFDLVRSENSEISEY
jgi:hypothetical protein